ncbi:MAG: beta-galactosidase [Sphaerochaeta sp.]|nr:beta-galactosidase [Sphaerochaeta sp.]
MLYGAQYFRPPFPRQDCWVRDFTTMEAMGFNCIKLWAVWNAIEKTPGVFDFTDLDALVALSKGHNLQVIINLIPEGAPYWTYAGDRGDLYATADGQTVSYGGPANIPTAGWPGRCMDDPEFSEMVMAFIRTTAAHYADNDAVICFDVWNEPHLEPMYDYRSNMLCYCKHSQREFTSYLKRKYQDLESLGSAWYRSYTDWDQVCPPTRFGTYPDMIDWRSFWLGNLQYWLKKRVSACKEAAPLKPVQTHVAYSGILGNKLTGGLCNELGDEFLLAREVDSFGLSSFPKWLMGEEHYYRHYLHNEMVAQAAQEKPFYQVELQGGGGKPGLLGGEVPTPEDISVWNYNTVACGGKGTIYWQYAPEPSGVESPGFGLTGFKGEETPRSRSASRCAIELNNAMLDDAKRVCETNAVFVSRKISLLNFAAGRLEELYAKSLSGVCKAAYAKGIPIRFIHEDHLDSLLTSSIKVLYVPMPLVLGATAQLAFRQFVQQGGTLILEACAGLYHETGELDFGGTFLLDMMGLEHREVQAIPEKGDLAVIAGEKTIEGTLYRQLVTETKEGVCSGRFPDGEPAVKTRSLGLGTVIWVGSFISLSYENSGDHETGEYLASLLDQSGYLAIEKIEYRYLGDEKTKPNTSVLLRMLDSKGKRLLVANNHTNKQIEVSVKFVNQKEPIAISLMPCEGKVVSA